MERLIRRRALQFSDVTVDASTGAITLRALFPNPDNVLLPNMYVQAVIEEGVRENAILVPQQAVTRDAKGQAIAMVVGSDNKVEPRPLKDCAHARQRLAARLRLAGG